MAALRDIARDFAAEIRDGIGWTIVYRTGRSWNALTIWWIWYATPVRFSNAC